MQQDNVTVKENILVICLLHLQKVFKIVLLIVLYLCVIFGMQAALPQGIVPFVFAKEYNVHPDILSTG